MASLIFSEEAGKDVADGLRLMILDPHNPKSLELLKAHFADDIVFQDPAETVSGLADVLRTFTQFGSAESVDYEQINVSSSGSDLFIHWTFSMKSGSSFDGYEGHNTGNDRIELEGVSKVTFNKDSRAIVWKDFWHNVPAAYRAKLR